MNYRHAFHAGNFADVMKHALLARILLHLGRKDTPFFVLDTHGGIGLYDLSSEAAQKTGEWRDGIGRLSGPLAPEVELLLAPYRAALAETAARHGAGAYPGSPLIIAHHLRPGDRALAVEMHPADHETLSAALAPVPRIRSIHLDGWTALHANIPPKEKRGLVIIDPPYEVRGELLQAARELVRALRKWPSGIMALWYPIKDRGAVEQAANDLAASGVRKLLRLELMIAPEGDDSRLRGCGLIVANPPWTLAAEAIVLLPALADALAPVHGGYRVEWLAGE